MSYETFVCAIKALASSQGYYARMLEQIEGMDEQQTHDLKEWVMEQGFKDMVDIIMALEV